MYFYLWEIFVNIISQLSIGYLLYKQLGTRKSIPMYMLGMFAMFCVMTAVNFINIELDVAVSSGFTLYFTRAVSTLLHVVFALIFCKGNISEKLFWSITTMLLIAIADAVAFVVISLTLNSSVSTMSAFGVHRFITTALHLVMLVTGCLSLARVRRTRLIIPVNINLILIGVMVLGAISIDVLIDNLYIVTNADFTLNLGLLVLLFAVILIIIVLFLLVTRVGILTKENISYQLENRQYDLEKKSMAHLNMSIEELRVYRHEMINNTNVMNGMLKNKEYAELERYFDNIANKTTDIAQMTITKIPAIDSLLYSKIQLATAHDVPFKYDIDLGNDDGFNSFDLCAILGNLLDNAIEATCKTQHCNKRFVELTVKPLNEMLHIKISNGFSGDLSPQNGEYFSHKSEPGHGLGLNYVRRIVTSYKGNMFITTENGVFTVGIILPFAKEV